MNKKPDDWNDVHREQGSEGALRRVCSRRSRHVIRVGAACTMRAWSANSRSKRLFSRGCSVVSCKR
jgi:hypothetical protein